MFKNHLTIAFRTFTKNKLFTFINVLGLSLGLSASFLVFTYVDFQRSFDTFHENIDNLYRVTLDIHKKNGQIEKSAQNYPALGPVLKNDFNQVIDFCRLYKATSGANTCTVSFTGKGNTVVHNQSKIYFADTSLLNMFSFPLHSGHKATALKAPNSLVLSAKQALKYFGTDEAIGKILTVNIDGEVRPYVVNGVFDDLPENSHFDFDFLLSYTSLKGPSYQDAWDWNEFYTYISIAPDAAISDLKSQLPEFIRTHLLEKHKKYDMSETFNFQPVKDIHLTSDLSFEMKKNGDLRMMNLLLVLGFAILFFAWANYVNLSLAVAIKRLKEVGIRKTLGANSSRILKQLIVEFSLLVSISLLISIALIFLIDAKLASFVPNGFSVFVNYYVGWLDILLLIVVGSFIAGVFPAVLIAYYKPMPALKGDNKNIKGGFTIKRLLLVGQFAVSILMIAGSLAIHRQMRLLKKQDLGMKIENILVLHAPNYSYEDTTYHKTYQSFKNEVLKQSSILDITSSSNIPGVENSWSLNGVIRRPHTDRGEAGTYYFVESDFNYIDFFGFDIVAGRDFSEDFTSPTPTIILNEKACKSLGFQNPEKAIGNSIIMEQHGDTKDYSTIVGVLKDYRQEYGKKPILPIIFWTHTGINLYYCIRLSNTTKVDQSVAFIKSVWNRFYPQAEFDYFFLEDFYHSQFKEETTFQSSFTLFTYQALIIACLGLLGLSILSGTSKLKEIGIRKVFGASAINIVQLLSRDLIRLVLISNVIGLPICYWLIKQWLLNYATRIELGWWFYITPGVILMASMIIVISYQLIISVRVHPSKILRDE